MRLEIATLSTIWHHALIKKWQPPVHEYSLLVAEARRGNVLACVASDGAPLALGGAMVSNAHDPARLWLSVCPDIGRQLPQTCRHMVAIARATACLHPPGVVCVVRDDNVKGQRLAKLLGFERSEIVSGSLREWRLRPWAA